jgi:cytoskeleton protein RodZ
VPRRQRFPPRHTHLDGTSEADARAGAGGAAAAAGASVSGPSRTVLRPPPWDKGAESDAGASFGTWLRRQREAREISLREVAERTKISLRYLEAMENDRFEALPAPVFAKGFLREYARYVGLSPDDVVNHYLSVQQPQSTEAGDPGRREARRPGGGWPHWLTLAVAIVLLLALAALLAFLSDRWRRHRGGGAEVRPAIVAPVPPPPPPAPPQAAPVRPSAPLEVTVDFNQECWVEAVVDGVSRRAEMREQGESMQLEARESVVFAKLGNAAAVDIQVNGYPFPLDKKRGEVVKDLKIDLDTVRALKAKKEGH